MPRVAFSFPISDVGNFFAHYDVLTQRPSGIDMRFDPTDYYFINNQSSNPFITNPNLKPEKTIDYEFRVPKDVFDTLQAAHAAISGPTPG